MIYLRFHLPVLLTRINYSFIQLCSICLICFPSTISTSTKTNDEAFTIAQSIDDYFCQNHVFSFYFRNRHHQQQSDNCISFLILHSCFYHDNDTKRLCSRTILNRVRQMLDDRMPKHCFTSSVYKTFYAQHLRSIAPARTIVKCQIFVLFFLLISFIIKIRACC